MFLLLDVAQTMGGTLSRQQQLALSKVLLVGSVVVRPEQGFFMRGILLFLQDDQTNGIKSLDLVQDQE